MPEFVPSFTAPGIVPDEFVRAYLEEIRDSDGWSPEAIEEAHRDCEEFKATATSLLARARAYGCSACHGR